MRAETEKWIAGASLEMLQCRELRHAWPRNHAPSRRKELADTAHVRWRVEQSVGGVPRVVTREMDCIGLCGVVRIETFALSISGAIVREGKPRYRHPEGYLRRRGHGEQYVEKIEPDQLRGIVVRRLFP